MKDLIDKLKDEEKQKQNNSLNVKSNVLLEKSLKLFRIGLTAFELIPSDMIDEFYYDITPDKYFASDLSAFIMSIKKYETSYNFKTYLGYYLSYLISKCEEPKITLHTNCLTRYPDNITLWTDKEVSIIGDVGDYLGYNMQNGKINLEGNAGDCVGFIMKNGIISISGNVGNGFCSYMVGGRIELFGDLIVPKIDNNIGGEIYRKGVKIV